MLMGPHIPKSDFLNSMYSENYLRLNCVTYVLSKGLELQVKIFFILCKFFGKNSVTFCYYGKLNFFPENPRTMKRPEIHTP